MDSDFKIGIRKVLLYLITVSIILSVWKSLDYIFTLEKDIRTLQHELDYMKYRVNELEKKH